MVICLALYRILILLVRRVLVIRLDLLLLVLCRRLVRLVLGVNLTERRILMNEYYGRM